MKTIAYITIIALLSMQSCIRIPSATMTDSFVEAANIGQFLRIVQLKEVQMDDTLGYPIEEEVAKSYLLALRNNRTNVEGNKHVKVFFEKRNNKFTWKTYDDIYSAKFYFKDTISIKPYTWYKLATEKYGFYIYFYSNGKKDDYALKIKPKPGAF